MAELARLEGLRVISRTSVMQYRNTELRVTEIAKELGVDAIVEGSVLRAGNEVRITVQLIDGQSDEPLWANSFEKQLDQVLSLQRNVASAIAKQIKWTFKPEDKIYFEKDKRPVVSGAYELCLKGWNLRLLEQDESLERALRYFDAAIVLDSNLYQAHAAKLVTLFLNKAPRASEGEAQEAVARAVELAPEAPESWMALAMYHQLFDMDIAKAHRAFKKRLKHVRETPRSVVNMGFFLCVSD